MECKKCNGEFFSSQMETETMCEHCFENIKDTKISKTMKNLTSIQIAAIIAITENALKSQGKNVSEEVCKLAESGIKQFKKNKNKIIVTHTTKSGITYKL